MSLKTIDKMHDIFFNYKNEKFNHIESIVLYFFNTFIKTQ